MSNNYFNTLPLREQLEQLGKCRFMSIDEFSDGVEALKGKKMVVIGCGAQGLAQGMNLRDSGCDVSYALREAAIAEKRQSWKNATENGFVVGTYEELIPTADVVLNLTAAKAAPLTAFIASYSSPEGLFYAKLSAASTMAIAPILILGWFSQKQLVRGLTFGAVK